MAITLVCEKCGKTLAYVHGDSRRLAASIDDDVTVMCIECTKNSRGGGRRLCKCGHPLSYHVTTGKMGPCVWKDWPRDGVARDEPISCRCKRYVEVG